MQEGEGQSVRNCAICDEMEKQSPSKQGDGGGLAKMAKEESTLSPRSLLTPDPVRETVRKDQFLPLRAT